MLTYNEFAYKKTKDDYKLANRFQKMANSQSHVREFKEKKTAYNEGQVYINNRCF